MGLSAPVWDANAAYRLTALVGAALLVARRPKDRLHLVLAGLFVLPFLRWALSPDGVWDPEPRWRLVLIFFDAGLLLLLSSSPGYHNPVTGHRWYPVWVALVPLAGLVAYAIDPGLFVVPADGGWVTTRAWLLYDGILLAALGYVCFSLASRWRAEPRGFEGRPLALLLPAFLVLAVDDAIGILDGPIRGTEDAREASWAILGAGFLLVLAAAAVVRLATAGPRARLGRRLAVGGFAVGVAAGLVEVSLPSGSQGTFHLVWHFAWIFGILAALLPSPETFRKRAER
ncbi:MAG: hypothetical protein ACT4PT_00315 [Methanobacteriota archaeon]